MQGSPKLPSRHLLQTRCSRHARFGLHLGLSLAFCLLAILWLGDFPPAGLQAHAQSARTVFWKDLVPGAAEAEAPFAKLTKPQLQMLSDVAEARDRAAAGEKLAPADLENERANRRKLTAAGIDVDGLLRKRREMLDEKSAINRAVNTTLDGQLVRIPGYLLPLEFKGKEVTEFLLVPWVGACIHTPPPPPNQIVHVKPEKPFASTSLFTPVWVTGRLNAAALQKSLHLVDGTSNIDVGYAIKAGIVEPYKEDAK